MYWRIIFIKDIIQSHQSIQFPKLQSNQEETKETAEENKGKVKGTKHIYIIATYLTPCHQNSKSHEGQQQHGLRKAYASPKS
jgi:uncharacterized cupin superfamily protein